MAIYKLTKLTGKGLLIIIGLIISVYVISNYISGNFYKIDDNAYRSAQLYSYNMPYYVNKYKIKSILNLTRGSPTDPDYINEIFLAKKLNLKLVNFKMSASQYLDYSKTSKLIDIMKNMPKPVLIHCYGGADRTSLASALYSFAILGKPKQIALKQFGSHYGHLPKLRPDVIAMDNSFTNYIDKYKQ